MEQPHAGRAFHCVLRTCMSESRVPHERELEQVAAKIWHDTYRATTGLGWSDVERGSILARQTLKAARAALGVAHSFWAELAA